MINLKRLFDIEKTLASLAAVRVSLEKLSSGEKEEESLAIIANLKEMIIALDEMAVGIDKVAPELAKKIQELKSRAQSGLLEVLEILKTVNPEKEIRLRKELASIIL
jgi:ABC-type ATPase with predicted acetyltransferase domain